MKRVSIFAIFCGVLMGFLAALALEAPLTMYVKSMLLHRGISEKFMNQFIQGEILATPMLYTIRLVSSCVASVVGGYFAARISRQNLLENATLTAIARFIFGLYSIQNIFVSLPLFLLILSDLASPAFSFYGGYLRLRECQKKTNT